MISAYEILKLPLTRLTTLKAYVFALLDGKRKSIFAKLDVHYPRDRSHRHNFLQPCYDSFPWCVIFFLTFIYSLISILPFILSLLFSLFVELVFIYHVIFSNSFLCYLSYRFSFAFLSVSLFFFMPYVISSGLFLSFLLSLSIYFNFSFDFLFGFFFFLFSFICSLSFPLLRFVYSFTSCEFCHYLYFQCPFLLIFFLFLRYLFFYLEIISAFYDLILSCFKIHFLQRFPYISFFL